jgi:uncharacterized protein YgbK (DUF1537 family)
VPRLYGIIADDLTGACDAGVQFAQHGLETVVWLAGGALPPADVVVLSTASRRDAPAVAAAKARCARDVLARTGRTLIFKKVDSTLRGNVLAEVEACRTGEAWVAPAFPGMGRQLIDGRLVVNGAPSGASLTPQPGIRICDAATQADLSALADAAFALAPRPLLAGSAGLAIEVARRLGRAAPVKPRIVGRPGPAVLYVGSTSAATVAQMAWLKANRDLHSYRLVPAQTLEGVLAAPVARYQGRKAAGAIMTGGDTAALVCEALGVRGIRLIREALPGIPYGTLLGGRLDGVPVITKAGGFGNQDALALLVDALREGMA